MKVVKRKISELIPADYNPRRLTEKQEKHLTESLTEFGLVDPIIVNMNPERKNIIIGGHQRLKVWQKLGNKEIDCVELDLSIEKEKELNIRLNANTGEWDIDLLTSEWDRFELESWGVDTEWNIEDEKELTETERLSEYSFEDIYYEPEQKPNIKLKDCLDLEKYNAKIKVINNSDLKDEEKEILKMFAYRFIKIDFENVANYYYFNASKEEQSVIERLRLVLCDKGLQGFIDDDLLKIHQQIEAWNETD